MKSRILLGADYSIIEPLGLLHLVGLAENEGWVTKVLLIKNHDFDAFFSAIEDFKPNVVGFNVYTGSHIHFLRVLREMKLKFPDILTVVGGPHPTYFPNEFLEYADHVVMSEGFGALRNILQGKAVPGILPMAKAEVFPLPNKKVFYEDYPELANSPIKSIISMTGCPYACSYCYNSSVPRDLGDNLPGEAARALGGAMGMSGRLFPENIRNIDDIIREAQYLKKYNTQVIYFQDDVFGFDIKEDGFLEQLAARWPKEVGIPFHAQMHWEMTVGKSGERRLDLIREAGGFGLTLATEAADFTIRKEILGRPLRDEIIFEGMNNLVDRHFRVRTEQITALPYGTTSKETKINLDADLEALELNVKLLRETGGPTMAWASTFAPYKGTKLGKYCENYGHYVSSSSDFSNAFYEQSVLRFPKKWAGPDVHDDDWLTDCELEKYRKQNSELRRLFNFLALVPEGHVLARKYLVGESYGFDTLGQMTNKHLEKLSQRDAVANDILSTLKSVEHYVDNMEEGLIKKDLSDLAACFACLPKPIDAIKKTMEYVDGELDSWTLSTAIRHHLYDNVMYAVN